MFAGGGLAANMKDLSSCGFVVALIQANMGSHG